MPRLLDPLDAALHALELEVAAARRTFAPFNSAHEGWAVIREEVDELWEAVKENRGYSEEAMTEAIQIAAMAVRYVIDLRNREAVA